MPCDPSPEQDLHRTRRRITAAFAATLIGLGGLTLLSMHYLLGLADSSSIVAERSAPAIQQLAEIRGSLLRARTGAREATNADGAHREALRNDSFAALRRIDDLLEDHVANQLYSSQERQELQAARRRITGTIEAVFQRIDQGDVAGARAILDRTRPDNEQADAALQQDIFIHSEEARRIAAGLHSALHQFVYESVALTLIGFLGAFVLLRSGVHSLRLLVSTMAARHAAVEERATELDAFAARVAHDLRGPLTAMRISLDAALKHSEPPAARGLERANASITTLDEMIGELLDFARSGARPAPGSACDPAKVIRRVASELQAVAEKNGITLTVELTATDGAAIEESPFRMIAFNVVENAIKYMGEGAERRIDVSLSRHGERLQLDVRDTGIGIPAEALPRIFEPFFRATSAASGYGLGLATVKRLVEAHRGEVQIESVEGQGTRVRVILPVAASVPGRSAAAA